VAAEEARVHEHIARAMYYFSVHLMYASIIGAVAWLLTSLPGTSATTKFWMWAVSAFNFIVPAGAIVDLLWAPHLTWAKPLGAIGGPIWEVTEGHRGVALGMIWAAGTCFMFARLTSRLRKEGREDRAPDHLKDQRTKSVFVTNGVPVIFGETHQGPAVRGVLYPRIVLPEGLDHLLERREFDAVLLHELAHARRHDNLIRLLYEGSLCLLWFHPLMWLAGRRMELYRELSCDESVIRRAHGRALVTALAKLAVPQPAMVLRSTASSHLSNRLASLTGSAQTHRAASILLTALFAAVIAAGVYGTIAHTACCFLLKR
jgi:beta-lactamase regulating signal transducer with metallopeptidase domain